MSDGILEFIDVSASYNGAIAALHGVGLKVRAGEFVALLGANGAGKTTLLKAASNLLPAERGRITQGQILLDGQDVTGATRATLAEHNLDRHWRNARTHTLHDPVRWKYAILGNYYLNGVNPPLHAWS